MKTVHFDTFRSYIYTHVSWRLRVQMSWLGNWLQWTKENGFCKILIWDKLSRDRKMDMDAWRTKSWVRTYKKPNLSPSKWLMEIYIFMWFFSFHHLLSRLSIWGNTVQTWYSMLIGGFEKFWSGDIFTFGRRQWSCFSCVFFLRSWAHQLQYLAPAHKHKSGNNLQCLLKDSLQFMTVWVLGSYTTGRCVLTAARL